MKEVYNWETKITKIVYRNKINENNPTPIK